MKPISVKKNVMDTCTEVCTCTRQIYRALHAECRIEGAYNFLPSLYKKKKSFQIKAKIRIYIMYIIYFFIDYLHNAVGFL